MNTDRDTSPSKGSAVVTGILVLVLTLALIVFSEHGYRATVAGLELFFEIVLPSLLPFFILSDMLLATGVVHALGVFFEPLMRPLFNVPGVGSFVFSMGLAAGYPMDAVLTAKFRRQGLCTKVEAERLLSFTNSADPLFLFGAVAVGMFGAPALGAGLALAHYASGIGVGILYRFYGRRQDPPRTETVRRRHLVRRAIDELYRARLEDGRPMGRVLNEAIAESISTLFMIMSFIVLFAVLLRILQVAGGLDVIAAPFAAVFRWWGWSSALAVPALKGVFEIDLGAQAAALVHTALLPRLMLVSAIVAWSGLSVHGQVMSVIQDTDISMKPYFVARFLHAVLAALLTPLFVGPALALMGGRTLPALAVGNFVATATPGMMAADGFHVAVVLAGLSVLSMAAVAAVVVLARGARVLWFHGVR
jgi:sporulation integral membrane protein YlbJ